MSSLKKYPTFAEELVKQEIKRFGPMTYKTFIEITLYHPVYGYYNKGRSPRGRSGDYFTSFQVSPVFSDILCDMIVHMRTTLDSDQFTLIEFGSGEGEFLERLLSAAKDRKELKGIRVISIEKSAKAREKLRFRLSRFPKCHVVESLEEVDFIGGFEGCIFSNELFDAFPFHRLRLTESGWKEIFIDLKNEELVDIELPLSDATLLSRENFEGLEFLPGQEIEFRSQMNDWFESLGPLFARGYMATFDYGYPRFSLYSPRRMKGTWNCFYKHQVSQNIFDHIGEQDITAHADFTQLVSSGKLAGLEPFLFSSQGLFLTHLGQTRLQTFLDSATPEERPKRIGVLQQLLHPETMGEAFWVLLQKKESGVPTAFEGVSNRLRRLL